jgi:protein-S-isoprenylcysteine O-methyltransferase Ste14
LDEWLGSLRNFTSGLSQNPALGINRMVPLLYDFKIGWLNGWLGTIPIILSMFILFILNKEAAKRAVNMSAYTIKEKYLTFVSTLVFYGAVLYSIGLPLKFGTMWFYIGFAFYTSGATLYIISIINFTTTPLNEPIVRGVYKISRNPMYFFSELTLFGIGIGCASWLMILIVIVHATINHITVLAEEKYCSEKYGESYLEYMKNTPRYFLFF